MKKLLVLFGLISTSAIATETQSFNFNEQTPKVNFKIIKITQNDKESYGVNWNKISGNESNINLNKAMSMNISTKVVYNKKLVNKTTEIKVNKDMSVVVNMVADNQCFSIQTNYNKEKVNIDKFCLTGDLILFNNLHTESNNSYIYSISNVGEK